MPPINIMIKPASGNCNMRCKYCFYKDEAANREVPSYGMMKPGVLEAVIKRSLSFAEGSCTFAFQGGEPTLAGLDFYRRAVELEQTWNVNRVRIENAIQTNGYLIDEEWAEFFAKNSFLVGISLDGPKEIHDLLRVDAGGNGTFSKVMHAIQLFKKHKVEFNILTVVTAWTCKRVQKILGFFERNDLNFQQYIPCLDPIGEERGQHQHSLTPELYEKFLKDLFDFWYRNAMSGRKGFNRYFDNLLMMLNGQAPEACGMSGICGRQYVVEADGSVYPCDFYALDKWKLGNLVSDTFEEIENKRNELRFIEISRNVHPDCINCKWIRLCRGGCRRDREPFTENIIGKNYFCSSYKNFFEYAYPRLIEVLRKLQNNL